MIHKAVTPASLAKLIKRSIKRRSAHLIIKKCCYINYYYLTPKGTWQSDGAYFELESLDNISEADIDHIYAKIRNFADKYSSMMFPMVPGKDPTDGFINYLYNWKLHFPPRWVWEK